MVIRVKNPIAGFSSVTHVVCPAQACAVADTQMGRGGAIILGGSGEAATSQNLLDTGDCEAPQGYGANEIDFVFLDGQWSITGGTGVWFMLSTSEYIALSTTTGVDGDEQVPKPDMLQSLLAVNQKSPLKLSAKRIEALSMTEPDYSGSVVLSGTTRLVMKRGGWDRVE